MLLCTDCTSAACTHLVVDAALHRLHQRRLYDEGDVAGGAAVPVVQPQATPEMEYPAPQYVTQCG